MPRTRRIRLIFTLQTGIIRGAPDAAGPRLVEVSFVSARHDVIGIAAASAPLAPVCNNGYVYCGVNAGESLTMAVYDEHDKHA